MNVRFINTTPDAEATIMYCARVSSAHQDSGDPRLLTYLIRNAHWSPFEMADMTVEITTSRAIAAQLLRHRSFVFQELSQRYRDVSEIEPVELRMQGETKQGSAEITNRWSVEVEDILDGAMEMYNYLVSEGVSRETARMILPLATTTKLYMKGSVRSWIHYLQVRTDEHTQKEHRAIALEIEKIFAEQFPETHKALKQM